MTGHVDPLPHDGAGSSAARQLIKLALQPRRASDVGSLVATWSGRESIESPVASSRQSSSPRRQLSGISFAPDGAVTLQPAAALDRNRQRAMRNALLMSAAHINVALASARSLQGQSHTSQRQASSLRRGARSSTSALRSFDSLGRAHSGLSQSPSHASAASMRRLPSKHASCPNLTASRRRTSNASVSRNCSSTRLVEATSEAPATHGDARRAKRSVWAKLGALVSRIGPSACVRPLASGGQAPPASNENVEHLSKKALRHALNSLVNTETGLTQESILERHRAMMRAYHAGSLHGEALEYELYQDYLRRIAQMDDMKAHLRTLRMQDMRALRSARTVSSNQEMGERCSSRPSSSLGQTEGTTPEH